MSVQRWAYRSLFLLIVIMPVWVALGRGFLGAYGWFLFLTIPLAVLVILPYHIILAVLAKLTRTKHLSSRATSLLGGYIVATIVWQITLVDGGDTNESAGSVLTFVGLADGINVLLNTVSGFLIPILMIMLLITIIVDYRTQKQRPKTTTSHPTK